MNDYNKYCCKTQNKLCVRIRRFLLISSLLNHAPVSERYSLCICILYINAVINVVYLLAGYLEAR